MFYTYAHYTPQGRLFYIGKGSSERRAHYMQGRNNYWNKIVAKYGKPRVEILSTWNDEEEAFSHEILLIRCFRDMGYELANIANGGEGGGGYTLTEEHKTKLSKARIGKPPWNKGLKGQVAWNKGIPCKEETKKKLSVFNLGKIGVKHTEETKNRIRVSNTGNTNPLKYKVIGTNMTTNKKIILMGTKEIKNAGFNSSTVHACCNGKRKSHKGYTWAKELLGDK